jgi:hypothetical protein
MSARKGKKQPFSLDVTFYRRSSASSLIKSRILCFCGDLMRSSLNTTVIYGEYASQKFPKRLYLKGLKGQSDMVALRHGYFPHTLLHGPIVIRIIRRLNLSFIFLYLTSTDR